MIGYLVLFLVFQLVFTMLLYRYTSKGFYGSLFVGGICMYSIYYFLTGAYIGLIIKFAIIPVVVILLISVLLFEKSNNTTKDPFSASFILEKGRLVVSNIRRGVLILGSSGSGKTASVVYNLLVHFSKFDFAGIIHDYKDYELTEVAYPLFENSNVDFKVVSFNEVNERVNPIAPEYLQSEDDINEFVKVFISNLSEEQAGSTESSTGKFFKDASEGIICGLIWRLSRYHKEYCTIPHLIALYSTASLDQLLHFVQQDTVSKNMANAFIQATKAEETFSGISSNISNSFKKIATRRSFYILSKNDFDLDITKDTNRCVVSVVNHPKYDTIYSPLVSFVVHTITKQMIQRNRKHSFLLLEEASTIRLLNLKTITALFRSFGVCTIYLLQDLVQNEVTYGKAISKAILANLSYRFFGLATDSDTMQYYEKLSEPIKVKSKSKSYSNKVLTNDIRYSLGEKEQAHIRGYEYTKLRQGEFVYFGDSKEKKVRFKYPNIVHKTPPRPTQPTEAQLQEHYDMIYREASELLRSY